MWQLEKDFRVILGGNTYINTPNIVVYKGKPLFVLKRRDSDGSLGIDFDIHDQKGALVATVRHGSIVQGNRDAYEIRTEADQHTITEKATGRMICDIRKRAKAGKAELDVSVRLYTPDAFLFEGTPSGTNLPGLSMSGNVFEDCGAAVVIQ